MNSLTRSLPFAACAILVVTAHSTMADTIVTATEKENQRIVRVDVSTPAALPTLVCATPSQPDSLAIVPGTNQIVYDEALTSQLRIVNPANCATDTLLADSSNGINSPQDIYLELPTANTGCPAGHTCVLVSNFLGGSVTRTDLTVPGTTVLKSTFPRPEGIAYDSTGRLFVLAGGFGGISQVFQINPVTGATINTSAAFDPTNTLDGLSFDPSTNLLFATSQAGNAVYSIDPSTLVAVNRGSVPTPDGITNNGAGILYIASRGTAPSFSVWSFNELTNVAAQLNPVDTIDDLAAAVSNPPSITKQFGTPPSGSASVPPGGTTTMTITITSPAGNPSTAVAFTDSLPAGVVVAAVPNLTNTCGGTVTGATAASTTVTLSGATVAAGGSCTITLSVTDNNLGSTMSQNCVTVTSANGSGNQSCALLTTLMTLVPLTVTKAFGAPTILLNGTTSMTISISNPNTTLVGGINFSDALPAGLVVATPNSAATSCTGTATATVGSQTVSLSGATLAASASCFIRLNVTGVAAGPQLNSVTVNTTNPVLPPVTATASLTVIVPPVISKSFGAGTVDLYASVSLSFNITNPNPVALTGVAFTDTLPVGLLVANPANLIGSCGGGTISAGPGSNMISLTGATLPAGGSCSFSVDVTGVATGQQCNTTSNVTSTNGGTGNQALACITVGPPDSYQVRYISNLNIGDGVVNITNTGALGADPFGPLSGTTGAICVNVYAFSPDEQEIACCSCLVTPNGLVHLNARTDLIGNTLTGVVPTSIVVKLLATVPGSGPTPGTQAGPFIGTVCNAAFPFTLSPAPPSPTNSSNLAPGLRAWGTTLHALPTTTPVTYGITEERFEAAFLSQGELTKLTNLCRFIVGNGTGSGLCRSCSIGALGAAKE
jgi:uncharacterized repeat protein (TIGR01451 family)